MLDKIRELVFVHASLIPMLGLAALVVVAFLVIFL